MAGIIYQDRCGQDPLVSSTHNINTTNRNTVDSVLLRSTTTTTTEHQTANVSQYSSFNRRSNLAYTKRDTVLTTTAGVSLFPFSSSSSPPPPPPSLSSRYYHSDKSKCLNRWWYQRWIQPLSTYEQTAPLHFYYWISCLICTLLIFVLLNIMLTLWIISSLKLYQDPLGVKYGGGTQHNKTQSNIGANFQFQIEKDLLFENSLQSNLIENIPVSVTTQHNTPNDEPKRNVMLLESNMEEGSEIHLVHQTLSGMGKNSFTMSDKGIELKTSNLVIETQDDKHQYQKQQHQHHQHKSGKNKKHARVIQLTPNQLSIEDQFSELKPPTVGGFRVSHLLNTSSLIAKDYEDIFRIESRTESLLLQSSEEIEVNSLSGDIQTITFDEFVVNTGEGTLQMDANNIYFADFKKYANQMDANHHHHHRHHHPYHNKKSTNKNQNRWREEQHSEMIESTIAYQICMCTNGKLFLVGANAICEAERSLCLDTD